jgi:hypothetical protein
MITIERTKELCKLWHDGQFLKDGVTPYWIHPFAVYDIMRLHKIPKIIITENALIVALLHDVLEDNKNITPDIMRSEGIPYDCINSLIRLTHKKSDDYFKYIDGICDDPTFVAQSVKLADLKHNSRIDRIPATVLSDEILYTKWMLKLDKYEKAYAIILKSMEKKNG